MTNCTFFSSEEWEQRLNRANDRALNFKTQVWYSDEVSDSEEVLGEMVRETAWERAELSTVSLEEVVSTTDLSGLKYGDSVQAISETPLYVPEECPHEAVEGTDRCKFHMSEKRRDAHGISDQEVQAAFLDSIKNGGRDGKIFTGATFGNLTLEEREVGADDNFPIHMEACEITGELNLRRSVVAQPLFINGSRIRDITCKDAEFARDVEFSGSVFDGTTDFTYTVFAKDAEFWNAVFDREVSFYASSFEEYAEFRDVTFSGRALFKYARVSRDLEAWDATFEGEANFNSMLVENTAEFRHSTFAEEVEMEEVKVYDNIEFRNARFAKFVTFEHLTVGGDAHYWNTKFEGRTRFWACEFQGYFECNEEGRDDTTKNASFHDDVTFRYTVFTNDAEFWSAVFEGDADFRDTRFHGTTEFQNVTFHGSVDFTGASHSYIDFSAVTSTESRIKLIDNELPEGTITQPEHGETYYDLSQSSVGDLDLSSPSDGSVFKYFKFYRTDFSGFDFANHRSELNKSWSIHVTADEEIENAPPADLETTYLKAKNGASDVGDTHAASEFFLRERKYQRRSYFGQLLGADTIRERATHLYKWGASWMYNLTCGYGERPFRTVGFGLLIIAVFTVIYNYTVNLPGEETPLRLLTFSIQTFVALLLGGIEPQNQTILVQFLTAFEAFIGGFAIALFVFALTRSVQR